MHFLQGMHQDLPLVLHDRSLDIMISNLCTSALSKVPGLDGPFRSSGVAAKVQNNFQQSLLLQLSSADALTHAHISAMMSGLASVSIAVRDTYQLFPEQQLKCRQTTHDCIFKLLGSYTHMLHEVGTTEASAILLSFAQVGLDPDSVCPGTTAKLVNKVAVRDHDRPAILRMQEIAHAMRALATLPNQNLTSSAHVHQATCTADIDSLRMHFMQLVCLPHMGRVHLRKSRVLARNGHRSNSLPGQAVSDFLCAYAMAPLQLRLKSWEVDALSSYLVVQAEYLECGTGHIISDALWAFGKLQHPLQPVPLRLLKRARRHAILPPDCYVYILLYLELMSEELF